MRQDHQYPKLSSFPRAAQRIFIVAEDDDDEEEDELDGLVMDGENWFEGVIGLGTKTFGDVRGETGAERVKKIC